MHAYSIAVSLALATVALAGTPTGATTSTSTSTMTLINPTKCPDPKDLDRHWEEETVLNDTREHHKAFKLFAYPLSDNGTTVPEVRSAVHVKEVRKDIWKLVLGEANADQPRWNLNSNGLETESRDSAPVNDTLYFRIYDAGEMINTATHRGTIYETLLTTNKAKNTYHAEDNTPLNGESDWSLTRDDNPKTYRLGSKAPGSFFFCGDGDVVYLAVAEGATITTPLSFGNHTVWESGPCEPIIIKGEQWL